MDLDRYNALEYSAHSFTKANNIPWNGTLEKCCFTTIKICQVRVCNEGIRTPSKLLIDCKKVCDVVCEVSISNEGIRVPSSQDYCSTVKKNVI